MQSDDAKIKIIHDHNDRSLSKRHIGTFEILVCVLISLSIIGIIITDYFAGYSRQYWIAMIVIFACTCLILEWTHARKEGQKWTTIVRNQLMLWGGLLGAIWIVFLLQQNRELDNESTGLIILLLLALATYFAGINLGLRLMVLGIFLGLAVIGAAYLEKFALIFLMLGIVLIGATILWKYQHREPVMKKNRDTEKDEA